MSGVPSLRAAALGLARHRALYPALRLRPASQRSATDALVELGFDRDEVGSANTEFEGVADELFPAMAQRAREAGEEATVAKLEDRSLPAHESKRLGYLAVRLARPEVVVETGTFRGNMTTYLLRGLADNGRGRLISFDLPAREPLPQAAEIVLPPGRDPGWIVPDELRDRLQLVFGDARDTLPPALADAGPIDVFVHDSEHSTRHMLFEFRLAWQSLRPGGILISDDIFDTPAFWWFTRSHRVPFLHIGNVGITRKPGGTA